MCFVRILLDKLFPVMGQWICDKHLVLVLLVHSGTSSTPHFKSFERRGGEPTNQQPRPRPARGSCIIIIPMKKGEKRGKAGKLLWPRWREGAGDGPRAGAEGRGRCL